MQIVLKSLISTLLLTVERSQAISGPDKPQRRWRAAMGLPEWAATQAGYAEGVSWAIWGGRSPGCTPTGYGAGRWTSHCLILTTP